MFTTDGGTSNMRMLQHMLVSQIRKIWRALISPARETGILLHFPLSSWNATREGYDKQTVLGWQGKGYSVSLGMETLLRCVICFHVTTSLRRLRFGFDYQTDNLVELLFTTTSHSLSRLT
jgi:hypothetical protein